MRAADNGVPAVRKTRGDSPFEDYGVTLNYSA